MLISKKTHCPKCENGMSRFTKEDKENDMVWAVYSCDSCTHAVGTIIKHMDEIDNYQLFNYGTLGNTYIKEKDYFERLEDYGKIKKK